MNITTFYTGWYENWQQWWTNRYFRHDWTKFEDFLEQIKEQKNIDMRLSSKYFPYEWPDKIIRTLYDSKSNADNYSIVSSIYGSFDYFAGKTRRMPTGTNKKENTKILETVNKNLAFNEQNQQGKGLKILTPCQMLSRLPISLAQLKAGNNSEKLKNEIRQLLYYLYRSKNLQKNSIKAWLTLFKDGNNLYQQRI